MKNFEFMFMIFLLSNSPINFSQSWIPDQGDGTYKNPIIHADYSDPDVIRVGDDFFMTASSFNCFPALPILHSKDLVNWEIINHAIDIFPDKDFDIPQHGNGIWAPALRYHRGEFWIFYGDPDRGIYMVKTKDIRGKWDPPVLVKEAKGWIDPCPLWEDGNAYLVHAFARSRAGINSILHVNKLNPDGTKVLDEGTLVFDGHENHPTIEGPKFYKRNGYYYIFAPAGGVRNGWQTVLRSRNIYGPYEDKIVLTQRSTDINGPHQGGYIELENGEGWFIHFQDKGAYGRIVHLQPVVWKDDWPVMGNDEDGDSIGEPVLLFKKPNVGKTYSIQVPQTSDDFSSAELGLQWQWHANYKKSWYSLTDKKGVIRLYSQKLSVDSLNLWSVPNLLLQKFPAPEFTVTTKIDFQGKNSNEKSGLIIMGRDYAHLEITAENSNLLLKQVICLKAETGGNEETAEQVSIEQPFLYLRLKVDEGAVCTFSYSSDGRNFKQIGRPFQAQPGKWIGAKVGLFASRSAYSQTGGYADFDFFRFE
jgi:beta-xylosidase